MKQTPIELIAIDMDGTLLNAKQQISNENIQAIREAQEKGVHIALSSGRTQGDIRYYIRNAGLGNCEILALNGACCAEKMDDAPYDVRVFEKDTVRTVIKTLLTQKVTFACFQLKRVIVCNTPPGFPQNTWGMHIGLDGAEAYAYGEEALSRYEAEGVCKIVYVDADQNTERIARIRRALLPVDSLNITSSWADNLEMIPEGVGKDVALITLAHRLSIRRERVMAIGDYDNDLAMLKAAGVGVAMGNATEKVKAAAKYVTLSNVENGVAEAIRRYAL